MNNLPAASDLLRIARETLVKEILPGASTEARYTLLMIANAMAIAAREAEAGAPPMSPEEARTLAREIRAGAYDSMDARRTEMLERLRAGVEYRLRISNPKALDD
jgi:hypothetical protein